MLYKITTKESQTKQHKKNYKMKIKSQRNKMEPQRVVNIELVKKLYFVKVLQWTFFDHYHEGLVPLKFNNYG